jgi:energy-coupling factor transporter transmembrane protein EcfT
LAASIIWLIILLWYQNYAPAYFSWKWGIHVPGTHILSLLFYFFVNFLSGKNSGQLMNYWKYDVKFDRDVQSFSRKIFEKKNQKF